MSYTRQQRKVSIVLSQEEAEFIYTFMNRIGWTEEQKSTFVKRAVLLTIDQAYEKGAQLAKQQEAQNVEHNTETGNSAGNIQEETGLEGSDRSVLADSNSASNQEVGAE